MNMTQKKSKIEKKQTPDKIVDNLKNKIKKLEKEGKNLKQQIKENEDKLLRSYADLKNYQKRVNKELYLREKELKKKYLSELIDMKELLNTVYKDKNPKKGLKLIINNLEKFLENEKIKYIDCIGKIFDHKIHHAITIIEKQDCEDETIIEEVKKGYLINDDLIRPSQVIVAKKNEKN